ncbi:MAG: fumarate hydratase [Candidatus Omnitrophica bacterium]|nr:fumarate hydratase [Candidatus Omnitrophota bacterium]MDD4982185.1 fumarate hydratase [Candidatus Omnitrophota bacterium]
MRVIDSEKIKRTVAQLCFRSNCFLRPDVLAKIKLAYKNEKDKKPRQALGQIIENAKIARCEKMALCQDTGLPIVFIEAGQSVVIKGDLKRAVLQGVVKGYKEDCFRESIVSDPLVRGRSSYAGAVIHTDIVRGDKVKITVMPKGFGCENKSFLRMFLPTTKVQEIKEFVVDSVKLAGPDACPPYVVGIGIGGSADYACLLAKKALLRSVLVSKGAARSLERDLLNRINKLKIGPMGLGGKATCLAVNIETYPTHIAGLPVAVNISCHALRSATAII